MNKTNSHKLMYVIKRDGNKEPVKFDKITDRIKNLTSDDDLKFIDPTIIAQKVVKSLFSGISTEDLDLESAKICANLNTTHPLYSILAGRILISNLAKKTNHTFSEKLNIIQNFTKEQSDSDIGLLDTKYLKWVNNNREEINNIIDYERDFDLDYFGFKTLERAYLIRNQKKKTIIERPQDMWMRVASFLNQGDIESTKITYDLMSKGYYTHASPTLFNSATKRPQLSSCFLLGTEDNLEGITNTWKSVSMISKWGGGIGLHVSNIRAKGSLIRGTNGPSSGIIPMLQVYNNLARYINQGGKRKGSFAIYLEPYHPDILAFLDLRKNFGAETERARDLFLALWISDLFMEQVEKDGDWYLMCPDECKGLNDAYGDEFNKLYWNYVSEGKYREKLKARSIMKAIMESQIETGVPYMLYKDSCNRKSNQKNLGTIKSSNLCAEILEFSDSNETAVCNLASIAVNKFVIPFSSTEKWKIYTKDNCRYCKWVKYYLNYKKYLFEEIKGVDIKKELNKHTYPQIYYGDQYIGGFEDMFTFCKGKYNYDKLYETAYHATVNLNKVIDINFYPTIESKRSNMKHRPIGLGVQGVADALVTMGIQFESQESLNFNSKMMETIYFAALTASNDISKKRLNGMKDLISFYNSKKGNLKIPKYYDSNKNPFPDDNLNKLYHELKIHSFEFDKENDNTIGSYSSFKGSPASKGILQFDMWDKKATNYDWDQLKNNIVEYGIRNSLVTALMPTASTSQILGNNSCFEFFTNNIYSRKTLAGDFALINKHLVEDLISINEWNNDIKQQILAFDGSISNLNNIPKVIKNLYKNIWEIKQLWVLKNALARAPFVDQTQSMNIFMGVPNYKKLFNSHFWGWKNGLKTGMYYLRSKPSKSAIKFTVDPKLIKNHMEEECEMCSA